MRHSRLGIRDLAFRTDHVDTLDCTSGIRLSGRHTEHPQGLVL
jgi:hypothetical protein